MSVVARPTQTAGLSSPGYVSSEVDSTSLLPVSRRVLDPTATTTTITTPSSSEVTLLEVRTEMAEKRLLQDDVMAASGSRDCCPAVEHLRCMLREAIVQCESAERRPLPAVVVRPVAIEERVHPKSFNRQQQQTDRHRRVTPPTTPTRPITTASLLLSPTATPSKSRSSGGGVAGQPLIMFGAGHLEGRNNNNSLQGQQLSAAGVSPRVSRAAGRLASPIRTTSHKQLAPHSTAGRGEIPFDAIPRRNSMQTTAYSGGVYASNDVHGGDSSGIDVLASMSHTPGGSRKYSGPGYYGQKNQFQSSLTEGAESYQCSSGAPSSHNGGASTITPIQHSSTLSLPYSAAAPNASSTMWQSQPHLPQRQPQQYQTTPATTATPIMTTGGNFGGDDDIQDLEIMLKEKEMQLLRMRVDRAKR